MTTVVEQVWATLEHLTDPEIPVVTLRELGILREVTETPAGVEVVITPTYTGCPAMGQIEDDVKACLEKAGIPARVVTRLAPAWTTDWMSEEAKEKLRVYGIAPPHTTRKEVNVIQFIRRPAATDLVACPRCGSTHTVVSSQFGSTACKALYKCLDCQEPFDYFKPY
ncbi:1,2-phenylacetyl-CoA epoxidase subunit PaaD [Zoogloea sp.]|uniref:1,2-phenylacetyl-CoA epoxidase subunit PaaD n=1 Tax=Zoogloea sp. TaxID=49181 RepID=UPI0026306D87|nr:1,2-phenylacetyl-CoA epoxidase subunit PaaD [Zoogloea sp.]MDD3353681.1 phenylacetate-CoA oxygenase subunit PaaJ [Zoogloea sp.]